MQEEVLHRRMPAMQQGRAITIDIISYLLGYGLACAPAHQHSRDPQTGWGVFTLLVFTVCSCLLVAV